MRERELGVLREAWESVHGGRCKVVAIAGEPGIGKTTLVRDFLAGVSEPVIRVHGIAGDPSWRVLSEILSQLPADPGASGAPGAAVNPQALPAAIRETLAAYLRSGKLAFLDDAQWADAQSLAALLDIGQILRSEPMLLVLAYQAGLPGVGAGRVWGRMLDSGQAAVLPLRGLPPEDILRLAVARGCHGLSLRDAARLHEVSGGNPGYLTELFPLLSSTSPASTNHGPTSTKRSIARCSRPCRDRVTAS